VGTGRQTMPAADAGLIDNGYDSRFGRHRHRARGADSHAGEAPDAPIWIDYEFQKFEPAVGGRLGPISRDATGVVKLDSVK
jgi:hypothetical protein